MSITSDIRTQSKQVLDQAQAQLNDVTGQATEFYGKARGNVAELATKATTAVGELRVSAEKAINLDAIKTAVEPYLAQVKSYRAGVTDRAENLIAVVKSDDRVTKLVDTAGSVTGVVLQTVQERVVKPVQSLTDSGPKPVSKPAAAKVAPTANAKPVTKPAATKAAAKPAGKPAARKAPVRRTTES